MNSLKNGQRRRYCSCPATRDRLSDNMAFWRKEVFIYQSPLRGKHLPAKSETLWMAVKLFLQRNSWNSLREPNMDKILLVDDDDAMRGMLKMRLSDAYEMIDTGDPVQALELALQHKPRAILLDLMMPDCSGFELCQS